MKTQSIVPSIDQTKYQILMLIQHSSFVTQRDIALVIQSTSSVAHYHIDRLEQLGLITRKYLSSRSILYYLTPKGVITLHKLEVKHLSFVRNYSINVMAMMKILTDSIMKKNIKTVLLVGTHEELINMSFFLQCFYANDIHIVGAVVLDSMHGETLTLKIIERQKVYQEEFDAVVAMKYSLEKAENQVLFSLPVISHKIVPFI